jgi:transposase-like protein
LCKGCGKRFSERPGTPMSRLRTSATSRTRNGGTPKDY